MRAHTQGNYEHGPEEGDNVGGTTDCGNTWLTISDGGHGEKETGSVRDGRGFDFTVAGPDSHGYNER
jgi:hypothetical protein